MKSKRKNLLLPLLVVAAAFIIFALFSEEKETAPAVVKESGKNAEQNSGSSTTPVLDGTMSVTTPKEPRNFSTGSVNPTEANTEAAPIPQPELPADLKAQLEAPPPELPEDLRRQLMNPPTELPDDLKAQLNAPPPPIPEDIKRALETPPRIVTIEEVNDPNWKSNP